jgi:uncharacterized protein (DUF58 family)
MVERKIPSIFLSSVTIFIVGLFLAAGLLQGQRDLALLSLLVLGVFFGARIWTKISYSGIHCRSRIDKRKIFPDDRFALSIYTENNNFLPVWLQVYTELNGLQELSSKSSVLKGESSLLWHQRTRFKWELSAIKRGVYFLGPFKMISGDLFGFFPKERTMEESLEVIVYPRLIPIKPFVFPRRDFFGIPGAESPVRDPVYILGTQDYQHGSPAKYIHWKASARHHRLQEKVFEPTQQEKVLFVVDVDRFTANESADEFERTIEAVASIAERLDRQGCCMGLMTNGSLAGNGSHFISIRRDSQHLSSILEVLARLQMNSQKKLMEIIHGNPGLPWGVSCLYFSFEADESSAIVREHFRLLKIPTVFFVCRHSSSKSKISGALPSRYYILNDIVVAEVDKIDK